MQHGDVVSQFYPLKKQLILRLRRVFFLAAVIAMVFLLSPIAVFAADVPAPAASSCPGTCTGSAAEVAHCETNSGTGACASGGACSAKSCTAGCTGAFFVALGQAEAGSEYNITNSIGCLGRWQICPQGGLSTFVNEFCGSNQAFLNNTNNCQDQSEISYQQKNWASLQEAKSYIGQTRTVNGRTITITQGGLMGAAQLCGVGGAILWLENGGSGAADLGGTTCAQYFANFANTTLPPQFPDASANATGSTCSGQTPTGLGGANPTGGANPMAGGGGASNPLSSDPSSGMGGMAAMLPMMMMMPMMMMPMMMSQMMSSLGNGSNGTNALGTSGNSNPSSPFASILQTLFNGSGSPSTSPAGQPTQTEQAMQELQQLEAEQAAAQQGASPASAIAPQSNRSTGDSGQFKISCASQSADPTLQNCRTFVPSSASQ